MSEAQMAERENCARKEWVKMSAKIHGRATLMEILIARQSENWSAFFPGLYRVNCWQLAYPGKGRAN